MTVDPTGRAVRPTLPLRGWVEREARVALETEPPRQALNQREHYTDLRGVNHPPTEMSAAEASLVLALLERHAVTLHRGELAEHLRELQANACQPVAGVEAYRALTATAAPTGFGRRRFTALSPSAQASD